MQKLINKIAIITGGARGIGKATAELFASEGATVIIWDVLDEGRETARELSEKNFQVEFYKIDTTDYEEVQQAAQAAIDKHGKIDILINNAGITRDASFLKMTPNQWQSVIDVNLTGLFNCTKAIAPFMVNNKYGRIVSTSSVVGIYGNYGQTNYAATKAGVIGMTKVWARELGKYGITSNAVAPGFVLTEMTAAIPHEAKLSLEEKIPVKRAGKPEDIANAYLFFALEESSFVNGAVLNVDGGAVI